MKTGWPLPMMDIDIRILASPLTSGSGGRMGVEEQGGGGAQWLSDGCGGGQQDMHRSGGLVVVGPRVRPSDPMGMVHWGTGVLLFNGFNGTIVALGHGCCHAGHPTPWADTI
uniref:Rieske domain-containing protein n=1 Tax=Eutreptiella gymnastica TaxID=73025 RepID=A0A7S4GJB6_9EUGL